MISREVCPGGIPVQVGWVEKFRTVYTLGQSKNENTFFIHRVLSLIPYWRKYQNPVKEQGRHWFTGDCCFWQSIGSGEILTTMAIIIRNNRWLISSIKCPPATWLEQQKWALLLHRYIVALSIQMVRFMKKMIRANSEDSDHNAWAKSWYLTRLQHICAAIYLVGNPPDRWQSKTLLTIDEHRPRTT